MKSKNDSLVLDLFSGCGGFSLGFTAAGFRILDGIELIGVAQKTHNSNFPSLISSSTARDIQDVKASEYLRNGFSPKILIGGPPCQPFTRVGRAKLREVAGMVAAHIHDERVTLYEHYLRFVAELKPLAFVLENVPDLGRFNKRNIAEEIAITATGLGYEVRYTLLNAAWYGVPQMRERVIIIGLHSCLNQVPLFPPRTHTIALPKGYITSRSNRQNGHFLPPYDHYYGEVEEVLNPSSAITAIEALSDLPPITEHLEHMEARKGARRMSRPLHYLSDPENHYQALMRHWPGFDNLISPSDHVIRYTPRDYETFRLMQPGDQYPEALIIAQNRFEKTLDDEEKKTGHRPRPGSKKYDELFRSIIPPYDSKKFPNKWRKIEENAPVRTIPAHIGKDSYSHIHFDSNQARMISVREAARLQSFPDGFRFAGSMNDVFRQIGNSVPPLLAYAVAASLRHQLEAAQVIPPRRQSYDTEIINGFFEEIIT